MNAPIICSINGRSACSILCIWLYCGSNRRKDVFYGCLAARNSLAHSLSRSLPFPTAATSL